MTCKRLVSMTFLRSFVPIYQDQPLLADVNTLLQDAGFELIDLVNTGITAIKCCRDTGRLAPAFYRQKEFIINRRTCWQSKARKNS